MKKKSEVVTFKADASLMEALQGVENRSSFIRAAVMAALDSTCPLCKGSGILTPNQRKHWNEFSHTHSIRECTDCNEFHLVCNDDEA